jgi:hypothetical protein
MPEPTRREAGEIPPQRPIVPKRSAAVLIGQAIRHRTRHASFSEGLPFPSPHQKPSPTAPRSDRPDGVLSWRRAMFGLLMISVPLGLAAGLSTVALVRAEPDGPRCSREGSAPFGGGPPSRAGDAPRNGSCAGTRTRRELPCDRDLGLAALETNLNAPAGLQPASDIGSRPPRRCEEPRSRPEPYNHAPSGRRPPRGWHGRSSAHRTAAAPGPWC